MPIERRSTRTQATTMIIMVCALIAVVLAAWLLLKAASGGSVRLGTDRFDQFNAKDAAASIAKDGPLLFSDVSGRGQNRPIFVTHEGSDFKVGWHVFEARAPGAPDECFLRWDAEAKEFRSVDDCDPATFPADGTGLRQYKWRVTSDGTLDIDLNADKATTTTAPG
jgi:hypothetical protein